jgi:hypothetical protein
MRKLAELLVRHGAIRSTLKLNPMQALTAACRVSDTRTVRNEIAKHPEFLHASEPLFAATQHNRRDAAELLLDLGTPDIKSGQGEIIPRSRPLVSAQAVFTSAMCEKGLREVPDEPPLSSVVTPQQPDVIEERREPDSLTPNAPLRNPKFPERRAGRTWELGNWELGVVTAAIFNRLLTPS